MEFSIRALSPETAKAGCVVLGVYAEKELTAAAQKLATDTTEPLKTGVSKAFKKVA